MVAPVRAETAGGALRSIAREGVPRHGRQVVGDAAGHAALTMPTLATGITLYLISL